MQLRTTIGHANRFNPILERVKVSQEYYNKNPRPTFNTITDYAPPGMPMSCVYIRNTSAIKFKFLNILREGNLIFYFITFRSSCEKNVIVFFCVAIAICSSLR